MHIGLYRTALSVVVGLALLGGSASPLHTALAATRSSAVPVPTLACGLSPVTSIGVLGYTAGAPLYAVSNGQLYRMSAASAGWTHQSTAASTFQALAPDPRAAGALLYVSATGVYRSADGGVTATRVGDSPAPTIAAVIRAASAPDTLYAVSQEDDNARAESRIYRSDDNGATWRQVYDPGNAGEDLAGIYNMLIDPADADHILAIESAYHGGSLLESRDGGGHWSEISYSAADANLLAPAAVAFGASGAADLWAIYSSWNGGNIYWAAHSSDGGKHWHQVQAGLPAHATFTGITVDSKANVYLAVAGRATHLPNSLYVTHDGTTFSAVLPQGAQGVGKTVLAFDGRVLTWDDEIPFWALSPVHPLAFTPVAAPPVPASATRYVAASRHTIAAPFLAFYNAHVGIATLGLPLSEATSEGGQRVQYFERARLVAAAGVVSPSPLGRLLCADRRFPAVSATEAAGSRYFPETRHTLTGRFLTYWQQHQGRVLLGPPISEPFEAGNGDGSGQAYLMQYFANARLEYHPEHAGTRFEVQPGLLGREYLHERGLL